MTSPVLKLAAAAARLLPMPVKQALYRLGPVSRLIRASLNRAARSQSARGGLAEVQVAGGSLRGARLLLDLQTEKDYWLGTYEPELQALLPQLATPGMTIYDVGANIGYISLMLAQAAGASGRVYAFEALPANAERLARNLALNPGLGGRVTLVAKAVTGGRGPVRFWVHASGGMGKAEGSAGRQADYQQAITVEGLSLDEFAVDEQQPMPQLIKMDIEGGEVMALPAARRLLAAARPILLLELHGPDAERVAWDVLTGLGYRLHAMLPGLPPVETLADLQWKAYLVALPPPAPGAAA